ncbi:hypothetical protein [Sulfurihydrogenibium sp.]|jgi:hypothetical protein|uniref:hypothetical protein n=1 Tax=Sulfurihydrogenibium sp. TaxID=2053621 RepID=UPI002621409C|nr:hypothetical protein [Sulfurihydrogenibium sp.]
MKRKVLLGAAIMAVGSTALVSCGGGASSSSGSGTPVASLQKDAVVTVSYPTSSNLSSQILSDDTKAIEVVFYQINPADSNGVVGGLDESGNSKSPIMYKTSVVLTPTNPTQTLSLFPADTVVCINQLDKDPNDKTSTSQPNVLSSFCSYAGLQKGNNNLTYTLLRGVWSLPSDSDINGYTQFAITNMGNYSYYYPTNYGTYFDYYLYNSNSFKALASQDGSTWNSSNYVEGAYANQLYQNGGTLLALASKKSDGSYDAFAALKDIAVDSNGAKYVDRYVDPISFKYSCNNQYGTCYGQKYVKVEQTVSFKVFDKNGNDVTSSILNTCKFSSTDGKSISGCLAKNVKEEVVVNNTPPANYTHKAVATVTTVGPNICYNKGDNYKDGKCLSMNYFTTFYSNGQVSYTCNDNGYTYNTTTGYCEADLKTACENSGGTFNSNTNTCTQTSTSYLSLTATPTTLTGNPKFPASTQITVQNK